LTQKEENSATSDVSSLLSDNKIIYKTKTLQLLFAQNEFILQTAENSFKFQPS
jgi:hypothetical protein